MLKHIQCTTVTKATNMSGTVLTSVCVYMCVLEGRGVHFKRKPVKQVFKPKAEI